jgi:hypothetical protein
MPAQRLAMRQVHEVLRLKWEQGLSDRKIAHSLGMSRPTVAEYVRRAQAAGLLWPLPATYDEATLERFGRVPAGCGEFHQSPLEPSEGYPAAGHQASKRVFSSSFAPPCRRVDRPIPLLCTPLFLANLLLHLGLRPRWHAIEQHFFERPDMVGQSGRHRGRTRPPPLGGARAIRPDWLCQGLA